MSGSTIVIPAVPRPQALGGVYCRFPLVTLEVATFALGSWAHLPFLVDVTSRYTTISEALIKQLASPLRPNKLPTDRRGNPMLRSDFDLFYRFANQSLCHLCFNWPCRIVPGNEAHGRLALRALYENFSLGWQDIPLALTLGLRDPGGHKGMTLIAPWR